MHSRQCSCIVLLSVLVSQRAERVLAYMHMVRFQQAGLICVDCPGDRLLSTMLDCHDINVMNE